LCFDVAYFDVTISASNSSLRPVLNASPGISKDRPSVDCSRRVHSRIGISASASEPAEPLLVLVPSSRFSTALTAFSSSTLHVYCTVLPTMGFLVF
jgi:hypothetical protein